MVAMAFDLITVEACQMDQDYLSSMVSVVWCSQINQFSLHIFRGQIVDLMA